MPWARRQWQTQMKMWSAEVNGPETNEVLLTAATHELVWFYFDELTITLLLLILLRDRFVELTLVR